MSRRGRPPQIVVERTVGWGCGYPISRDETAELLSVEISDEVWEEIEHQWSLFGFRQEDLEMPRLSRDKNNPTNSYPLLRERYTREFEKFSTTIAEVLKKKDLVRSFSFHAEEKRAKAARETGGRVDYQGIAQLPELDAHLRDIAYRLRVALDILRDADPIAFTPMSDAASRKKLVREIWNQLGREPAEAAVAKYVVAAGLHTAPNTQPRALKKWVREALHENADPQVRN